jgi:DNA mismatch repair protein MSH6
MAKAGSSASVSTPTPSTPALKKSTSNTQNMKSQKTLHGFFQRTPRADSTPSTLPERSSTAPRGNSSLKSKLSGRALNSQLTPAPSSDGPEEQENIAVAASTKECPVPRKGLPSPVSSANDGLEGQTDGAADELATFGTPSRRVRLRMQPLSDFRLIAIGQDEENELCRVRQRRRRG